MLQVTVIGVLLCLAGTAWSADEGAFETEGAAGRGPRIVEHAAPSECKQEKNWGICADEDWGPKCPSGCRIQGLADQTDKDFGRRVDAIRKSLTDNQNTYKSADVVTKETYNLIKENLVAAQSGEGVYGQVSEDLRRRIANLKIRVTNQLTTIKALENSIRGQIQNMKRLEVDIDIKIRACKGSCAKAFVYNVDPESYDNMQKQLLQAASINLQPDNNDLPVLKMRPLKDEAPTHFKALPSTKFDDGQYDIFSGIEQRKLVIERSDQEAKAPVIQTLPHSETKVSFSGGENKGFEASQGGTKSTSTTYSQGKTIACTKTTTRKTVHGPDGPKEEIIESYSGGEGDECTKLASLAKDGTGSVKEFVVTGGEKKGTSTVTTQGRTIQCTKVITKKIVHGPDGPKEEITESFTGGEGDECTKLGSLAIGEKGTSGGTYNIKVTSSNGFSDLSHFPSLDEFFQTGTGSRIHTSSGTGSDGSHVKDGSSTTNVKIYTSKDVISDLGDGETEHFEMFNIGSPSFASSSSTKTVVSGSSGHTKEGSPFESKTMKSGAVFDDLGPVQHDESGEDTPDLNARSVKKEPVNLQEDYTGTGKGRKK